MLAAPGNQPNQPKPANQSHSHQLTTPVPETRMFPRSRIAFVPNVDENGTFLGSYTRIELEEGKQDKIVTAEQMNNEIYFSGLGGSPEDKLIAERDLEKVSKLLFDEVVLVDVVDLSQWLIDRTLPPKTRQLAASKIGPTLAQSPNLGSRLLDIFYIQPLGVDADIDGGIKFLRELSESPLRLIAVFEEIRDMQPNIKQVHRTFDSECHRESMNKCAQNILRKHALSLGIHRKLAQGLKSGDSSQCLAGIYQSIDAADLEPNYPQKLKEFVGRWQKNLSSWAEQT